MAFEIATVTAHIAGLQIAGRLPSGDHQLVRIFDYDGVTSHADARACPILQPDVNEQVLVRSINRDSFGPGGVAKTTLVYVVPYKLLYLPLVDADLYQILPMLVVTCSAIFTALVEHDTPEDATGALGAITVDVYPASAAIGRTVNDPGGTKFHGATFGVQVMEHIN